eukprot:scaffold38688_cov20-Tisochrysis_lutea.AAC.1
MLFFEGLDSVSVVATHCITELARMMGDMKDEPVVTMNRHWFSEHKRSCEPSGKHCPCSLLLLYLFHILQQEGLQPALIPRSGTPGRGCGEELSHQTVPSHQHLLLVSDATMSAVTRCCLAKNLKNLFLG